MSQDFNTKQYLGGSANDFFAPRRRSSCHNMEEGKTYVYDFDQIRYTHIYAKKNRTIVVLIVADPHKSDPPSEPCTSISWKPKYVKFKNTDVWNNDPSMTNCIMHPISEGI